VMYQLFMFANHQYAFVLARFIPASDLLISIRLTD